MKTVRIVLNDGQTGLVVPAVGIAWNYTSNYMSNWRRTLLTIAKQRGLSLSSRVASNNELGVRILDGAARQVPI